MRSLIVIRGGDKSLHTSWLLSHDKRTYDIALSYYGDNDDFWKHKCDYFCSFRKSKFEGLSNFVENNLSLIERYDFVWFVDDDLWMHHKDVEKFFEICRKQQFVISQPSLMKGSFYSWEITLQRKYSQFRQVDFVEIMAPCFRVKDFHLFRETFKDAMSGYGLEWLWAEIGRKQKRDYFAIVDEVSMLHTREVGGAGSGGATSNPEKEMKFLLKKYNIQATKPQVIKTVCSFPYFLTQLFSFSLARKFVRKTFPELGVKYKSPRF